MTSLDLKDAYLHVLIYPSQDNSSGFVYWAQFGMSTGHNLAVQGSSLPLVYQPQVIYEDPTTCSGHRITVAPIAVPSAPMAERSEA